MFELRSSDTVECLHWPMGLAYIFALLMDELAPMIHSLFVTHQFRSIHVSAAASPEYKKLITKHPVSFWGQSSAFVQFQCDSSVFFAMTIPHSSNSSHFIQLSLFCIHKKCKVWNANLKLQEVQCQLNECTIKRTRLVNGISQRVH